MQSTHDKRHASGKARAPSDNVANELNQQELGRVPHRVPAIGRIPEGQVDGDREQHDPDGVERRRHQPSERTADELADGPDVQRARDNIGETIPARHA